MSKPPSPPEGRIVDYPPLSDGLPAAYLSFLHRHDAIGRWDHAIPLDEPLETKDMDYPIPWDHVSRLVHYAPNLSESCKEVEWGNKLAPFAGLRYAYTRLQQHAHVLSALEDFLPSLALAPTGDPFDVRVLDHSQHESGKPARGMVSLRSFCGCLLEP
jgi:hypothetical protein